MVHRAGRVRPVQCILSPRGGAVIMSEALRPPFTVDTLFALPDTGLRCQVLEGELVVSSAAEPRHNLAADRLRGLLVAALPADIEVIRNSAVRLPNGDGPTPDLLVTTADPEETPRGVPAALVGAHVPGARDRGAAPGRGRQLAHDPVPGGRAGGPPADDRPPRAAHRRAGPGRAGRPAPRHPSGPRHAHRLTPTHDPEGFSVSGCGESFRIMRWGGSDLDDVGHDHRAAAVCLVDPAAHRAAHDLLQLMRVADAFQRGPVERLGDERQHPLEDL